MTSPSESAADPDTETALAVDGSGAPIGERPPIIGAIRKGALFMIDAALSSGRLEGLPLLDRLATALFQFDFLTARACLEALDESDVEVRDATRRALLLQGDEPASPGPPPADIAAQPSDGARDLVLTLAEFIEQGLVDVLNRRHPDGLDDPLRQYVFCRLMIHIHPDVASAPRDLFTPKATLSEGQIYCMVVHSIHSGHGHEAEVAVNGAYDIYRGSAHLFFLKHLLAVSRNAVDEAKAWLLNAWTAPGIDERLTERVHALFALDVDCPDADYGLRAMKHVGHAESFAVRRGSMTLSARPDSPHARAACLAHADQDLIADCERALQAFRERPTTWQPGHDHGRPENTWSGSDKVFLCLVPAKSGVDLGLALSAHTLRVPIWADLLGTLVIDQNGRRPTLSDLMRDAALIRTRWIGLETNGARRNVHGNVINLLNDPRDLPAMRILWPGARFILCVPDQGVVSALAEIDPALIAFDQTLVWRRLRDMARLMAACGIPGARRKALARGADHWRGTFYPL